MLSVGVSLQGGRAAHSPACALIAGQPISNSDVARCTHGRQLPASLPCVQVQETPELYKAVVLPHIESFPASRLQWVYNILEKMVRESHLKAGRDSSLLSQNAEWHFEAPVP